MPEETKEWLFTWGYGQVFPNRFVRIQGNIHEARDIMFKTFGRRWSMQYSVSDEHNLLSHSIKEINFEEAKAIYEKIKEIRPEELA